MEKIFAYTTSCRATINVVTAALPRRAPMIVGAICGISVRDHEMTLIQPLMEKISRILFLWTCCGDKFQARNKFVAHDHFRDGTQRGDQQNDGAETGERHGATDHSQA